jgi:RNA polymerase sigma factor (sigma-70 family)
MTDFISEGLSASSNGQSANTFAIPEIGGFVSPEPSNSNQAPVEKADFLPQMEMMDPSVLRYLRHLLKVRPILRLDWETLDFFQEVSTRYMTRVAGKGKVLRSNAESAALLRKVARRVCVDQLRHLRAKRRDVLRRDNREPSHLDKPSNEAKPLDRLVHLETLERIRKELSEREWEILRLHGDGFGWVEIASQLGMKPSGVRMAFSRMATRLASLF